MDEDDFVVTGDDYYELDGDDDYEFVVGDVMGDVMGDFQVVGRRGGRRKRGRGRRRGGLVAVKKPGWRRSQLAPGVIAPDQGLVPLTLTGTTGTNTFTNTLQSITFQGQLQKPFRGERLLVSTVRTGATATGRLIGQLFIGTDLQQGDVSGFDLEQVGSPQAFGVRLTMKPATPGVVIRIPTTLNVALGVGDTIIATVTILGRIVQ